MLPKFRINPTAIFAHRVSILIGKYSLQYGLANESKSIKNHCWSIL